MPDRLTAHDFVAERRQQDPKGVPICQCGLPFGAALHQRAWKAPAPRRETAPLTLLTWSATLSA